MTRATFEPSRVEDTATVYAPSFFLLRRGEGWNNNYRVLDAIIRIPSFLGPLFLILSTGKISLLVVLICLERS